MPYSASAWQAAMLCAGFILNVHLLESMCRNHYLIASPGRFALTIGILALFLCAGVVYFPARLINRPAGTFDEVLRSTIGPRPAWLFLKILIPVWAFGWFAILANLAIHLLEFVLDSAPHVPWEPGPARTLAIYGFWLLLIAPAAKVSLSVVAAWSVGLSKVSFCALLGLALSVASRLPTVFERWTPGDVAWTRMWAMEPALLVWAVPPLLLCIPLLSGHFANRRSSVMILVLGVAVPVGFAILAAMLTTAGSTTFGVRYWKIPSYLGYAMTRPEKLGWAKILFLSFTFLTASRFAAHRFAASLPGARSWGKAISVTLGLLAGSFVMDRASWAYQIWLIGACSFAPLAGVLCGVSASTGCARPARASLAWAGGCLVTLLPWAVQFESWSPWMLLGWFVSLLGSHQTAQPTSAIPVSIAPPGLGARPTPCCIIASRNRILVISRINLLFNVGVVLPATSPENMRQAACRRYLTVEPSAVSASDAEAYARIFIEAGVYENGELYWERSVESGKVLAAGLTGENAPDHPDESDVDVFIKTLIRADLIERLADLQNR